MQPLTKTRIGNYLRRHLLGDQPTFRQGFKEGIAFALKHQPAAQWVGLTDEEMRDLEKQFNAERVRTSDEEYLVIYPGDYWQWQRAIEAKLREKNGGKA